MFTLPKKFAEVFLLWTIGIALNLYVEQLADAFSPKVATFVVGLVLSVIASCWPLILSETARQWRIEKRPMDRAAILFTAFVFTTIGISVTVFGLMGKDILLGENAGGVDKIGLVLGGAISVGIWTRHTFSARS